MLTLFSFLFLTLLPQQNVLSCTQPDLSSLSSFHRHISASPPLNWSSSALDCCRWEGVSCTTINRTLRVNRISLPGKSLSGTLNLTSLKNLSHLSHLNLSGNRLSGNLQSPLPDSIQTLDLSSNQLNGSLNSSLFFHTINLITFNISHNSLTGLIPSSSICSCSPFLETLDLSDNHFDGLLSPGFSQCLNLRVLRAGSNHLSGFLPQDVFNLKNLQVFSFPNNNFTGPINGDIINLTKLTILELQANHFSGEIPFRIGSLSNLQQLQLHTNNLNGTLPPSLIELTNLTTLLLRNNNFTGDISDLDFSNLQRLQAIDLGSNNFIGEIPSSLCLCRSLTAVRLAYNKLTGTIPTCMASLRVLAHFSVSDNYFSDVLGALRTLKHCDNLAVLFMSRCFSNEPMPDDDDLGEKFQNLQILTFGGCELSGEIPSWISKLNKLKMLNLSYNNVTGPIPTWLGSMPSLFVMNFTQNFLTGRIPKEISRLPALISDNTSTDLSSLALPFLFDAQQYNRLFNLPRGLKLGHNRLSGEIPRELGRLKLLHVLDLGGNEFSGGIPSQLSSLVNLERLDMSENRLTGEIPGALTGLSFLSAFSVADNDLSGEIPRGGQFETFGAAAFEGNPKLCGEVIKRSCHAVVPEETVAEEEGSWISLYDLPFGLGYFVGLFAVMVTMLYKCSCPSFKSCCAM